MAYGGTRCAAAEGSDPVWRRAQATAPVGQALSDPMKKAEASACMQRFEFMQKMGIEFFCFHDRDVAPEGDTLAQTNKNLDHIVKIIKAA